MPLDAAVGCDCHGTVVLAASDGDALAADGDGVALGVVEAATLNLGAGVVDGVRPLHVS